MKTAILSLGFLALSVTTPANAAEDFSNPLSLLETARQVLSEFKSQPMLVSIRSVPGKYASLGDAKYCSAVDWEFTFRLTHFKDATARVWLSQMASNSILHQGTTCELKTRYSIESDQMVSFGIEENQLGNLIGLSKAKTIAQSRFNLKSSAAVSISGAYSTSLRKFVVIYTISQDAGKHEWIGVQINASSGAILPDNDLH